MEDKSKRQIAILYALLAFFIDLESLLWDIAGLFIKPLALIRGAIAKRLSTLINN